MKRQDHQAVGDIASPNKHQQPQQQPHQARFHHHHQQQQQQQQQKNKQRGERDNFRISSRRRRTEADENEQNVVPNATASETVVHVPDRDLAAVNNRIKDLSISVLMSNNRSSSEEEEEEEGCAPTNEPPNGGLSTLVAENTNGGNSSSSSSNSNTNSGKIFVGSLSFSTTSDSLRAAFSKSGQVKEATVMWDKTTGKSRRFGFVTFEDPAIVVKLVGQSFVVDGRKVEIKKALTITTTTTTTTTSNNSEQTPSCPSSPYSLARSDSSSSILGSGSDGDASFSESSSNPLKIFVGGLAPQLTDADLRTHFSAFGLVNETSVMYDRDTKRSRGFGFVTFFSAETVDAVVRNTNHVIGDKWVEIKRAESREAIARKARTGSFGSNGSVASTGSQNGSASAPQQQSVLPDNKRGQSPHSGPNGSGHSNSNKTVFNTNMSATELVHAFNPYSFNPVRRSVSLRQRQQSSNSTPGGGSMSPTVAYSPVTAAPTVATTATSSTTTTTTATTSTTVAPPSAAMQAQGQGQQIIDFVPASQFGMPIGPFYTFDGTTYFAGTSGFVAPVRSGYMSQSSYPHQQQQQQQQVFPGQFTEDAGIAPLPSTESRNTSKLTFVNGENVLADSSLNSSPTLGSWIPSPQWGYFPAPAMADPSLYSLDQQHLGDNSTSGLDWNQTCDATGARVLSEYNYCQQQQQYLQSAPQFQHQYVQMTMMVPAMAQTTTTTAVPLVVGSKTKQ